MDKYELIELLAETRGSIIYRANSHEKPGTVIIKKLKTKFPTPGDVARFRQEYNLIRTIDLEGVIKTYDIVWDKTEVAIVMEDFEGVSLKRALGQGPFDLRLFLEIGIKISEALGHLHQMEIIHRDIKPQNILINRDTGQVKLTDFGIATCLTRENEELYNPEVIAGTLSYLSPEQTGRMNRALDYRTDLYSLGITFYEMLVGIVPFRSKDPMEVMHGHMAIRPPSPFLFNPDIPDVVSDIVMKLMMKTPEERYQNAFGLMADLKECLKRLDGDGHIVYFQICRHDISNKFIIPPRLYGRQKEIDRLLVAYEAARLGENEMVLIQGKPGIGKTTLIDELQKSLAPKKAYFIRGKYEQLRKDVPYSAIIQAFQKLIRQILSEREARINVWKEKFTRALGDNAGVIVDVIPDMALMINGAERAPDLEPEQAKNRFNSVFEQFVHQFADETHSLVMVLDNLQWADDASLEILRYLITSPEIHHLMIVVAYRDNDLWENHSLVQTMAQIRKDKKDILTLELAPLFPMNIRRLIMDFLKCSENRAAELGGLIYKKTGGNPFFVNQFLKTLYDKRIIFLDPDKGWQWDTEKIKSLNVTDNLVDLLVEKLKTLSENTRITLQVCACIGNRFDLETLAMLMAQPLDTTLDCITEAIIAGMLDQVGDMYFYHHDRIQEAAYSMISDQQKRYYHYRIGRLLLEKTNKSEQKDKLFYIVDQLNEGIHLVTDSAEKAELLELNVNAGRKARASVAYSQAFTYFEIALGLLEKECWRDRREETFQLYLEAIEAAFFTGDFVNLDVLIETCLRNIDTLVAKAHVLSYRINACRIQQDFSGAVRIGLNMLVLLGIPIPEQPDGKTVAEEIGKVYQLIEDKSDEELIGLPEMTSKEMVAAVQIMSDMSVAVFNCAPEMYPLLCLKRVVVHLEYGSHPLMSLAFLSYGVILTAGMGDVEGGYRFGNLAYKIVRKYNARTLLAEVIFIHSALIRHWKEPLENSIRAGMEAYQVGIETGRPEMASLGLLLADTYGLSLDRKLGDLEKDIHGHIQSIVNLKQTYVAEWLGMWRQYALNLMGRSGDPLVLKGDAFNEDVAEKNALDTNDYIMLNNCYYAKAKLAYIFGDYRRAMEYLEKYEAHADMSKGERGLVTVAILNYLGSLIRLALYDGVSEEMKRTFRWQIDYNQKKLLKWADINPGSFLHRYYLVEAERARVDGNTSLAMDAYDQAVSLSRKNRYLLDQALANELAAGFYLHTKRKKIARVFMGDAIVCYTRWGAMAKVMAIEERYESLLKREPIYRGIREEDVTSTTGLSTGTASEALDVSTVMKVSQAISGEIVLSKLMERMMKIVMENAGAEKGFVILARKKGLMVEAEGTTDSVDVSVLKSISLDRHKGLSAAVVNYVARTKETLILKNASVEGEFIKDEYILNTRPKSILCTPILYQGQVSGVLYLENNLTEGAFTRDRLSVLNVISSQIAVSIRNANLYEETLRWSKAAEAASQAKSELLNNIINELVNPMDAIVNLAGLSLEADIHGTARTRVVDLKESADNLLRIIMDIVELVKLETDEFILENNCFFIPDIVQQVYDIHKEKCQQKDISLVREIEETTPYALIGDTRRLIQVLRHLLGNAVKFTEQGTVSITVRCTGKTKETVQLEFCVQDTGIGIKAEDKDIIFDAFRQADRGYSKKYEGTGIGLAICRKTLDLMNGTIRLESMPGKGSTFSFTLAFARQPEEEEVEFRKLLDERCHQEKNRQTADDEDVYVVDKEEIAHILGEIKRRIIQSDFNTEEYVRSVRKHLVSTGLVKETKRLENQAGVFEFDHALDTLKEMAQKLNVAMP